MCNTSKLKWVILVLLSPQLDSRFLFHTLFEGIVYALFPITHQTIQYTTFMPLQLCAFIITLPGYIHAFSRSTFSVSFFPSIALSLYLPLFQSHAICVLIIITHATRNSNTICPIFNSTEVTRFSFCRSLLKRGLQTMKQNKYYPRPFFTIRYTDFQKKKVTVIFSVRVS